jgi:CheY-like chemotaxis protein
MGFTELALGDVPSDSSARARMRQVLRAAVRGRELVRQILAFSRKSDEKSMVISVTPLLNETLALLRVSIPSSIAVKVSMTAGNDTVKASGSNLQQVIMNLVVNAAQAVPRDGGSIEITLEEKEFRNAARLPNRDMQLGNYIALTVRDNGHGMSQTTRKRIFEPFFTTKETDTGTGIGLSMVYEIVKGHGGGITVWSKPDRGTTFRVFLPLIHVSGREDGTSVANTVGGSERIIFVDDEEAILESTVTILQRFGYKTTGFTDSEKALEYFTANRERVDLLIADYDMPNMTGIELAERSRRLKPDLRVIIVTGYHGSISAENAREAGIDELVMKPFTKQELGEVVHRVLTSDATGNEGPPRLSPK